MLSSMIRKALLLIGALAIVMGSFFLTLKVMDYWETPPGKIEVSTATYGGNCRAPTGNVTKSVQAACDGKESCRYVVNVNELGDPAGGCLKDYAVQYYCRPNPDARSFRLPGEADGKTVYLFCD